MDKLKVCDWCTVNMVIEEDGIAKNLQNLPAITLWMELQTLNSFGERMVFI